jgi:hypothetical protein
LDGEVEAGAAATVKGGGPGARPFAWRTGPPTGLPTAFHMCIAPRGATTRTGGDERLAGRAVDGVYRTKKNREH